MLTTFEALVILQLTPFVGAIFVAFLPATEIISARYMASLFVLINCFLHAKMTIFEKLIHSKSILPSWIQWNHNIGMFGLVLSVAVLAIFLFPFDKSSSINRYFSLVLFLFGIGTSILTLRHLMWQYILYTLVAFVPIVLTILDGYDLKGSTAIRTGIFLLVADLWVIFLILSGTTGNWWVLGIWFAVIGRLLFLPAAPWFRLLQEQSTSFVIAVWLALVFPLSAFLLHTFLSLGWTLNLPGSATTVLLVSGLVLATLTVLFERRIKLLAVSTTALLGTIGVACLILTNGYLVLLIGGLCGLFLFLSANMHNQHVDLYNQPKQAEYIWWLSILLSLGIPGIGVGAKLWPLITALINGVSGEKSTHRIIIFVAIVVSLICLQYALTKRFWRSQPYRENLVPQVFAAQTDTQIFVWFYALTLVLLCQIN